MDAAPGLTSAWPAASEPVSPQRAVPGLQGTRSPLGLGTGAPSSPRDPQRLLTAGWGASRLPLGAPRLSSGASAPPTPWFRSPPGAPAHMTLGGKHATSGRWPRGGPPVPRADQGSWPGCPPRPHIPSSGGWPGPGSPGPKPRGQRSQVVWPGLELLPSLPSGGGRGPGGRGGGIWGDILTAAVNGSAQGPPLSWGPQPPRAQALHVPRAATCTAQVPRR